MNLVEKVLARASGRASVAPGDVVAASVDTNLFHDLSIRSTRKVFDAEIGGQITRPEDVIVVFDHMFSPPSTDKAEILRQNRQFCQAHGFNLYDCGNGNLHHVATRRGHISPGALVAGSDSHTPVHGALGAVGVSLGNNSHAASVFRYGKAWLRVPETVIIELVGHPPAGTTPRDVTLWLVAQIGEGKANYLALRFEGEYIESLTFWDRWLFPLVAVDVGAKIGYIEPDRETERAASFFGAPLDGLVRSDPDPAGIPRWRFDISQELNPWLPHPPTSATSCPCGSSLEPRSTGQN